VTAGEQQNSAYEHLRPRCPGDLSRGSWGFVFFEAELATLAARTAALP